MKQILLSISLLLTSALAQHAGIDDGTDKAPMRFLWPEQRDGYDNATDDQAPCGGRPIGSRTDFPLSGGALAFVQGEDAFDAQIAISYSSNPGVDDFQDILTEDQDVDIGHVCYGGFRINDGVAAGSPATFRIEYKAGDKNETFYICADINFVDSSSFTTQIPCFNATTEETDEQAAAGSSALAAVASSEATATSEASAISGKLSVFFVAGLVAIAGFATGGSMSLP